MIRPILLSLALGAWCASHAAAQTEAPSATEKVLAPETIEVLERLLGPIGATSTGDALGNGKAIRAMLPGRWQVGDYSDLERWAEVVAEDCDWYHVHITAEDPDGYHLRMERVFTDGDMEGLLSWLVFAGGNSFLRVPDIPRLERIYGTSVDDQPYTLIREAAMETLLPVADNAIVVLRHGYQPKVMLRCPETDDG